MYQQIPVNAPMPWTVPPGVTQLSAYASTGQIAIPDGPPGPPPPPNVQAAYGAALGLAVTPGDMFQLTPGDPSHRGDLTISRNGSVIAACRNGQSVPLIFATFVW